MKAILKRVNSLLYLLPAVTLFCIFLLNPIFQAVRQSFYTWKGIAGAPMIFVGLRNYKEIIQSPQFWLAMRNSGVFLLGGFFVLMPLAFLLATIITSSLPWTRFFKTAFFMPIMLPLTAVGLMWVYILEPNWGLLNSILSKIGGEALTRNWLGTPNLNVITVVLVNEWTYAGFNMLIFASGLVTIPQELYEAAIIDGADKKQKLFYITLPMMKSYFKIFSVLCVTGCLKTFDLMFSMTGGGPNGSSEVPATLLYNEAFVFKDFGHGNTIGTVILLTGFILSLLLTKVFKEDY